METKICGASDDLLEFEGEIYGEIGYYNSSEDDPIRVKVSDGTEFDAFYNDDGLWKIKLKTKGPAFVSLEEATDPDSDNYTDILRLSGQNLKAEFKVGAADWEKVR